MAGALTEAEREALRASTGQRLGTYWRAQRRAASTLRARETEARDTAAMAERAEVMAGALDIFANAPRLRCGGADWWMAGAISEARTAHRNAVGWVASARAARSARSWTQCAHMFRQHDAEVARMLTLMTLLRDADALGAGTHANAPIDTYAYAPRAEVMGAFARACADALRHSSVLAAVAASEAGTRGESDAMAAIATWRDAMAAYVLADAEYQHAYRTTYGAQRRGALPPTDGRAEADVLASNVTVARQYVARSVVALADVLAPLNMGGHILGAPLDADALAHIGRTYGGTWR